MRYDSAQYGSFDGLDNRRTIMQLFVRMGKNLPHDLAGARRKGFLEGLKSLVTGGLKGRPILIDGLPTAGEAYDLFVAITGCLDVPIERAAILLECAIIQLESLPHAAPFDMVKA